MTRFYLYLSFVSGPAWRSAPENLELVVFPRCAGSLPVVGPLEQELVREGELQVLVVASIVEAQPFAGHASTNTCFGALLS